MGIAVFLYLGGNATLKVEEKLKNSVFLCIIEKKYQTEKSAVDEVRKCKIRGKKFH